MTSKTTALSIRRLLLPALILGLGSPTPAAAQFGGLLGKKKQPKEQQSKDCAAASKNSVGKSILGGVLGQVTGQATQRMGVVGSFVPRAEVAGLLTNAIACKLDPDEQVQAADATVEATRGEEVGSTAEWTSNSRDNVSGSSTVTQKTALNDGSTCMDVSDVVIVDGQETKVSKRMCKARGQSRYAIMA